MENKRKLLLVMGVCFSAVLCVACFGKKSNPVSSGGQSVSSDSQTTTVSQQTQGSQDNEVAAGDIGEPTQTQKKTGKASTKTTAEKQSSTTSASPPTTGQDGFYAGHR